ncbi:MAG TPA: antibiotic biosynthesis monooxygenase [Rhodopila sp.]|nr:antibiotic biosynthesis monooxygenase [Rhodopila sp.]
MFAVIFEVAPRPDRWDVYLGHAASLRPELLAINGFIANERYASKTRPGWLVSLSLWRNEKALIRWRTHALHHDIQGKGRSTVFSDYHLRVGEVTADTRADTPLPQQRLDETETGIAKAVVLSEFPAGTDPVQPTANVPMAADRPMEADGLLEWDVFDSITRPGVTLSVQSWRDLPAATASIHGRAGDHRVVRIIRDYGMHVRHEAPQYFPPI